MAQDTPPSGEEHAAASGGGAHDAAENARAGEQPGVQQPGVQQAGVPVPPAQALPLNTLLTLARKATGLQLRSGDVTVSLVRQAAAEGKATAPDPVSDQVEALRQDSAQILEAAIDALTQTIEQQAAQQREREALLDRERAFERERALERERAEQRARAARERDDAADEGPGERPRATVREARVASGAEGGAAAPSGEPDAVVTPAPPAARALGYDRPTPLARGESPEVFDAEGLDELAPELGLPAPDDRPALPGPGPATPPAAVAGVAPAPETGWGAGHQSVAHQAEPQPPVTSVPGGDAAPTIAEAQPLSQPQRGDQARATPPTDQGSSATTGAGASGHDSLQGNARRDALRAQLAELERRRQALAARRNRPGSAEAAASPAPAAVAGASTAPPHEAPRQAPAAEAEAEPSPASAAEGTETPRVATVPGRIEPDEIAVPHAKEPSAPEAWDEFSSAPAAPELRPSRWVGPSWRSTPVQPPASPQSPPNGRFSRMQVEARPGPRRDPWQTLGRLMTSRLLFTPLMALVLLALAVLVTPLPEYFGWQILPVLSGSMAPAIPVGSIVAVHPVPARDLREGDVITFADRGNPDTLVTHRIVSLDTRSGQQVAITKGDANNTTDSWNVPLDQAVGRVDLSVPYLGYFVVWLGSPLVKLVALALVLALLLVPSLWTRLRRGGGGPAAPPAEREPSFDELAREIDALLGTTNAEHAAGDDGREAAAEEATGAARPSI